MVSDKCATLRVSLPLLPYFLYLLESISETLGAKIANSLLKAKKLLPSGHKDVVIITGI